MITVTIDTDDLNRHVFTTENKAMPNMIIAAFYSEKLVNISQGGTAKEYLSARHIVGIKFEYDEEIEEKEVQEDV